MVLGEAFSPKLILVKSATDGLSHKNGIDRKPIKILIRLDYLGEATLLSNPANNISALHLPPST